MNAAENVAPGTYLRVRREAAGVSIGMCGPDAPLIEACEKDITIKAMLAYDMAVSFDREVLIDIVAGAPVQICVACGCSQYDPCETEDGPCAWETPGLCTACIGKEPRL